MTTINNISHANKDIIRLTETLRTSLLTLPNSIYINIYKVIWHALLFLCTKVWHWVGGWMSGWMGGRTDGRAGFRIAYSNQKI